MRFCNWSHNAFLLGQMRGRFHCGLSRVAPIEPFSGKTNYLEK